VHEERLTWIGLEDNLWAPKSFNVHKLEPEYAKMETHIKASSQRVIAAKTLYFSTASATAEIV
jgi:hypothetical protein